MFVFDGDVVKSDNAISSELRRAMHMAVESFEATILKVWHSVPHQKVLDLVHLCMTHLPTVQQDFFPTVRLQRSKTALKRCGEGQITLVP